MVLKRFYHEGLAHASYLIGCPAAGEAAVIDPNRDISQYLDAAANEGLSIVAVSETHIHADFVSGSRELAHACGARLYLSDEGDEDWKYAFADEGILVRDGDSFRVGAVRLDVRHTPGHTPEHISFVITDEATSPLPQGVFTGDFVFVGDVGRPDLLETAAGVVGTMEPGARSLYRSITEFKSVPPHVLLWPAHGAGSACGKSLGGVPVTTLGYESASNWAFLAGSEDSFVREVLAGQPEPPRYFAQMKKINKMGPPLRSGFLIPARETSRELLERAAATGVVVDIRPSSEFAAGHIPGSLHIPLYRSFVTWAGWFLPYDEDITLIASNERDVEEAVRAMMMIGLDRVAAWFGPEALTLPGLESYPETTFSRGVPEGATLLDVRSTSEWGEGHIDGAMHISLGYLPDQIGKLPPDRPVAVYCGGGARSPVAASILQRAGIENVVDLSDGYEGYLASRA